MKSDKLKIIYEDKYLLVIDKPYHLLSIGNDKEKENTLYHKVSLYLKKKNKKNKVFIVHRLDYDTSGLIIFAKDIKTKTLLQESWNQVKRQYMAIVIGKVERDNDMIKSYLKETKTKLVYSTNGSNGGTLAITTYRKVLETNKYTLLDISIKTGKKNQIRVHMKDIGNPILGDSKYGYKGSFKRMYLYAYYLSFKHPITNEELEFEMDIPKDFLKVLGKL